MNRASCNAGWRSRRERTRLSVRTREFGDDQISIYFTVRQYWGAGPQHELCRGDAPATRSRRGNPRAGGDPSSSLQVPLAQTDRVEVKRDHAPYSAHWSRISRPRPRFTVLAVARALKAQGKDVVELEIGDSPYPDHAPSQAGGHPGDRGERDRLLPEPGPARISGDRGPVCLGRVWLSGSAGEHRGRVGGEAVRAVFRRGGDRSRRRRPGLQPTVSDVRAQHRAQRCAGRAVAVDGREAVSALGPKPSAHFWPPTRGRGRSS